MYQPTDPTQTPRHSRRIVEALTARNENQQWEDFIVGMLMKLELSPDKRAAAEHIVPLLFQHQAGAEDPEDRPRGTNGRVVGTDDQRAGRAREPRDEIEEEKAARPDAVLEQ